LLLTSDAKGAYNIGTGRGIAVRQVIEWLANRFGARELVHFGARPQQQNEPALLVADMVKVERDLGWRAPTSIESGLERLVQKAGEFSPA
jgi:nucleoside-diphosphate-sugar epimerase